MSILVPFNGSSYIIPTPNEIGWGTNLDNYLVAIANGTLQNIGGSFTLSNDVNFGGTNGLKALYYQSRTSNIATTGIVRLANNGDSIAWRNFTNTGNHELTVNSSDLLCFDGTPVAVGGSGTVLTGTANTLAYYSAATNVVGSFPAPTAFRALQSDTNGLPSASSVTSTELGYLSGVTSAIQTQINNRASLALDNLSAVAINTSLLTSLDNTIDLGSTSKNWRSLYLSTSIKNGSTTLATATELGFLTGVTSAIQTQLNAKATDTLVVHLAGTETITGAKTLSAATGNPIHGTNTNDDASTGYIGEQVQSLATNVSFPTANTWGDATSISLTAGDWDIDVLGIATNGGGVQWTAARIGVSTTSGNSGSGLTTGDNEMIAGWANSSTTPVNVPLTVSTWRTTISTTTTFYLKYQASYGAGTAPVLDGRISARRRR